MWEERGEGWEVQQSTIIKNMMWMDKGWGIRGGDRVHRGQRSGGGVGAGTIQGVVVDTGRGGGGGGGGVRGGGGGRGGGGRGRGVWEGDLGWGGSGEGGGWGHKGGGYHKCW